MEETDPALEEQAARAGADLLWTDEVGVAADHPPGYGYARAGEGARREAPGPHLRVNQLSAISNEGTVRFLTYQGALHAAVLLLFVQKRVAGAGRKMLLSAERLPTHKTPEVAAWAAAHRNQLEVF